VESCRRETSGSANQTVAMEVDWTQWRTGGVWGVQTPPKFQRPSKIGPTSTPFEKTVKNC